MKRILLSLFVAGGLAMMAAPNANAMSGCGTMSGKSFALSITGAEFYDGTGPFAPTPTPMACLGVIQVAAATAPAACAITGEMICDDNDFLTAPATCTPGGAGLAFAPPSIPAPTVIPYTGTVPCFNGTSAQLSGSVTTNSANQGDLIIVDSLTTTYDFAINDGLGSASFTGTSRADDTQGGHPGVGPQPPILAIDGRKQGTAVTTGIANVVWGTLPWKGETTTLAGGASTADSVTEAGAFGSNSGLNKIIDAANAGGTLAFNSNNDWLYNVSAVLPGQLCHYVLKHEAPSPFADGTSNVSAVLNQPYSGVCAYVNIAGAFSLSTVLFGATNNNSFSITTGTASASSAGVYGLPNSAGILVSAPAADPPPTLPVTQVVAVPSVKRLGFGNSTSIDCIVSLTKVNAPASNFSSVCTLSQPASAQNDQPGLAGGLSLVSGPGADDVYPGYSGVALPLQTGVILMTCSAKPSVTGNSITVASPNCPTLNGSVIVNN
jgi:hypothetical protein